MCMASGWLPHGVGAASGGLGDFDAHREAVPQILEVRDDEDLLELGLNGLDGFHDALAAFLVLRAEAFVDDQCLEAGTSPGSQQLRQGDANREVDAESLATRKQLVRARAELV